MTTQKRQKENYNEKVVIETKQFQNERVNVKEIDKQHVNEEDEEPDNREDTE